MRNYLLFFGQFGNQNQENKSKLSFNTSQQLIIYQFVEIWGEEKEVALGVFFVCGIYVCWPIEYITFKKKKKKRFPLY